MLINNLTGPIINTREIYIHDDILMSLNFDRIAKKMELCLKKQGSSNKYTISFIETIGFEGTACDFWGASECVLDFEYIETNNNIIIPKLLNEWKGIAFDSSKLYDDFFETLITFSSGDKLRIACKEIEYLK